MKKRMTFRRVDRLFIVVYSTEVPEDDEFNKLLQAVNRDRFGVLGQRFLFLVATEGGEPSEEQRRRLDAIAGFSPVAVLSVSRRYRAQVNMKSWFGVPIKAFKMSEVDAALDFLKIPTQQYGQVKTELQEAFRELG